MNLQRYLFAQFDRISETPDAIPCLRRFILDLAVRGKLAKQGLGDEAAPLVGGVDSKGSSKQQNTETENSWPSEIPRSWKWRRLGNVSEQITDGEHATPPRIPEQQVPLVTAKNVRDGFMAYEDTDWVSFETAKKAWVRCRPTVGDVLLVCVGATTGRLCVLREARDMVLVRSVALIRPTSSINVDYLAVALRSPMCQGQIWRKVKVSAQPCLYINRIHSLPIPIPPLAEQNDIVAKVGELMALCHRLEEAHHEQRKCRKRLTAATLHHVNNVANAATFPNNVRFYLTHFPRLTTRSEEVQALRETILNVAVRGQLVPQYLNDEPATELLKRIQAEKVRLVREGIIKGVDPVTLPSASEFPYPMPSGWTSSHLQALCTSVTDGDHLPPPKADKGIPFLVIGNVRSRILNFVGCRHVTEQYYEGLDAIRRPQKGDILYTLVGSYGIPIMVTDDRQFCVQRHIGILRPSRTINVPFLSRILASKWVFDQATACATGIAQKTVPLAGLRKMLIPLPPLAEQHRIVAKIDELMALCDRLETRLATAQTESRRLLDAILNEALSERQAVNGSTSIGTRDSNMQDAG